MFCCWISKSHVYAVILFVSFLFCIYVSEMFRILSTQMDKFLLIYVFYLFSIVKFSYSEDCLFKSTCECVFRNGSVIDLSSLGSRNSYRWGNMRATQKLDNFTYFYNPCYGFSLGTDACAKGVAVCQASLDRSSYYDCGDAGTVNFHLEKNVITLIYSSLSQPVIRRTNVSLICSEDAETPELTVLGELSSLNYALSLRTKCACPDLCRTSHLSTGSVLLILFLIFVSLYLFLGIIHSSLTRGAQGWELLPHYEFWTEFPLLVRDGCVFVVNGCKTETAYERI